METKMNARVLARRLRARLAEMKKQRKKDIAAYDMKFEAWKSDVVRWMKKELPARVGSVTKHDFNASRYNRCCSGLPERVFAGMPERPKYPKDDAIRSVQKSLRFIAITGQASVQVSERQLNEWFPEEESEEDDLE